MSDHGTLTGGFTDTQPASDKTQAIADQVKPQLEEKEKKKFSIFKAVVYRSQVVAGTNYVIKVQVGDDDYVHIQVFESLPHLKQPPALGRYQTNKTKDDKLEIF